MQTYMLSNIFACRGIFFIVAFYTGLWTIRIPDIKDQINTDYLGIGYIFFSFALGSIMIMLMANSIIKKYSSKKVIKYAGFGQAFTWLAVPLINNLMFFLILAFLVGIFYGIFEVSMNLQASNIEKQKNKSMMSNFHAYFSIGLLTGSIFTSLMVQIQLSLLFNIILVVLFMLPLTIIFSDLLDKDLSSSSDNSKKNIFFIWPLSIFILVIFTLTDSFTEGSVDAWAALYMRDVILVKGFQIGSATIAFNLFMVIGRLIGDKIRDLIGTYYLLIILFLLSLIGLTIVVTQSSLFSSIIGFSIIGLGVSIIVPLAYSIAGKIKEVDSAVGISIISISAYGVFMIAPAILGLTADIFGLEMVFLPIIFLFIICFVLLIFNKKNIY
tara:strand:+ start:539 stop:1687 length:1149 start_codon:yes stop_codon:yes gene_type:complete